MEVKILDCTLRDGGYLVDKHFHKDIIYNVIKVLTQARVDFVELGFLQDEYAVDENVCFKNSVEARKYIPKNRENTLYTAFADYSRYSIDNLDEYDGRSFDCVRACFFKEERKAVLDFCRGAKRKGYKLFVQPVGILRYSTSELLDLIKDINEIEPYCFGIVDTFGSMYLEDLELKTSIIHSELSPSIMLGFHSHCNMNLSDALSQMFIKLMKGRREICVDATLLGMGRGAGNAHTECITEYLNKMHNKNYELDLIVDVIESSISVIAQTKKWGYSLPMFIAGTFGSHINNVNYLLQKASFRTRDIRYVLSKLTDDELARYTYSRLDELFIERIGINSISTDNIVKLRGFLTGKSILIVAPGNSISIYHNIINDFISKENPIVISINFVPDNISVDYIYFNNPRRYDYASNSGKINGLKKILTNNVIVSDENSFIINIKSVMKSNSDNSSILLLNLLDVLNVAQVSLAGFDGFSNKENNYVMSDMEKNDIPVDKKNSIIKAAFDEFMKSKTIPIIRFITPSIFDQN